MQIQHLEGNVFKDRARKFGKLSPLKLPSVSERRGLVSEPCQIRAGGNHPIPKPVQQVHRLPRLRHPHTDFVSTSVALRIVKSEWLQSGYG
jgi:hypothetical protein